jgi:hypothetical protein
VCCLFSLVDSRLDIYLMASVPGTTNEGTHVPGEPFVFPSYGNIGLPHIATLSLPGLTIGLPVWFFSTQVILNATSAYVVSTSPQEHQPHVDPSPSSPIRSSSPSPLARSSSISSSSSSESSQASNPVGKKKKKRKNKKKKNKQESKIPTTAKHVGKQSVTVNRTRSVDDTKITQTTRKPKYPCRLCKGSHLLKDFPGLPKVIEAWSTHPRQPMSSTSEKHVDDPSSTSQDNVGKKISYDLDPTVDMVISLVGLLELDLLTPIAALDMCSFQSVFLLSSEDLLEAMTDFCPLTWCPSRTLSSWKP